MAARRIPAIERLLTIRPDAGREELAALIMCGDVLFEGETVRDPQAPVPVQARVTFKPQQFVGRGAIKLARALDEWTLDIGGKVFVDVGASTGGFTDVLLRRGAAAVHAVDVGYNQLDYRLRSDPRVHVHERTNIMHITQLDPRPDAAVADLSFRSLAGAARHALGMTAEQWGVVLVKPQFEWEEPPPDFEGKVPEDAVAGVLIRTLSRLAAESVYAHACIESPIRGRYGNREFLVLVRSRRPDVSPGEVAQAALTSLHE